MTVLFVFVGLAVAAGVVLLILGLFERPEPVDPDRPMAELPPTLLHPDDVDDVRFGVGLRGYRMDEVDGVLDRLSSELAERDARVAQLEEALAAAGVGDAAPEAGPDEPAPAADTSDQT